ncbi:MAG: phasin family protein [Thermomonas sp.]|uniref:phasin family protein n=1 Tax=Thermomonas sp. TaxID=1971895 RepID=UPI001EB253B4|nr:phasin family protein [Thermomonas sp.]MBV2208721.1 phasin family protein [Thermomonas sp.]
MYQFNDQFNKSASQFIDAATAINRLALENAEKAFGLQLAAFEENANATFAFAGELVGVRDADGLKTAWPKGLQIARANAERSFGAAQEAFAGSLKAGEAIGSLTKAQFEQASSQVKAEVEKATKAASKASK